MRAMSFALTPEQLLDGSKTVTRRRRWNKLKPGDKLIACRKAMGLKKGEKREDFGVIEILSIRREKLKAITQDDVRREGFPGMNPAQFIAMFCQHMKCDASVFVRRIEFKFTPHSLKGTDGNDQA